MNFVRNVLSSKAAASSAALRITEAPVPIHYTLSSFRWHLDSRSPAKVIAVHDYVSSSAAWQQTLHECLGDLPLSRLTPTMPLEVYNVELRGHNFSEAVPIQPTEDFTLACAADLVQLQRDVLRSDAALTGIGLGAQVACCAALHAPDAFSGLVLFVSAPSQLESLDPTMSVERRVVGEAPPGMRTLAEINQYAKDARLSDLDRVILLSSVEEKANTARFRFSAELLQRSAPFTTSSAFAAGARFDKPVTVFVYGNDTESSEVPSSVTQCFPQAKFLRMSLAGESLYSSKIPTAPMVLQSLGLLGEVQEEPV